MLDNLRDSLLKLHLELTKNGLVTWTSGNISALDPETGYVVLKPSGVRYEELRPEDMVIVDLNGQKIEGDMKPSSDTPSYLYIYRQRPDIKGVVHTHSPYATAFAALGKADPCLPDRDSRFGGPIPCGDFAIIGGEEIGMKALEVFCNSPAVHLKQHGVYTIGTTPEAAVKAAVMVEDVARTVWIAMQIGIVEEINKYDVARLRQRYLKEYGQ